MIRTISQTIHPLVISSFGQLIGDPCAVHASDRIRTMATVILGSAGLGCLLGKKNALFGVSIAAGALINEVIKFLVSNIFRNQFQLSLEEKPPTVGKTSYADLRVSTDVEESLQWKWDLIQSAENSIELSANYAGGKEFRDFLNHIAIQLIKKPNLKVHMILSRDLLEKDDLEMLRSMAKDPRFVYLITDWIFCPYPWWHKEENHVKVLVVDQKYFVVGGSGIHPRMSHDAEHTQPPSCAEPWGAKVLARAFHDADVVGCGDEVAQDMRRQFYRLFSIWEKRTGHAAPSRFFAIESQGRSARFHKLEGLVKRAQVRCIVSGPEHRQKNPIVLRIARLIRNAKNEIRLQSLFFNPPTPIRRALQNQKVQKLGYFNGDSGQGMCDYLSAAFNRPNYNLLTKAFEYNKRACCHNKVMTVDGKYTVIGSANLGLISARCDYEMVCEINSSEVAKRLNDDLKNNDRFFTLKSPQYTLLSPIVLGPASTLVG